MTGVSETRNECDASLCHDSAGRKCSAPSRAEDEAATCTKNTYISSDMAGREVVTTQSGKKVSLCSFWMSIYLPSQRSRESPDSWNIFRRFLQNVQPCCHRGQPEVLLQRPRAATSKETFIPGPPAQMFLLIEAGWWFGLKWSFPACEPFTSRSEWGRKGNSSLTIPTGSGEKCFELLLCLGCWI